MKLPTPVRTLSSVLLGLLILSLGFALGQISLSSPPATAAPHPRDDLAPMMQDQPAPPPPPPRPRVAPPPIARPRGVYVDVDAHSTPVSALSAVVDGFFGARPWSLSRADLAAHFARDEALRAAAVYVRIVANNVDYDVRFQPATRHSRFRSLRATLARLAETYALPDVEFIVLLNDGFQPRVPAFGSARHWSSWTSLIPAPIGNDRGGKEGFGTSFEGWDEYINHTAVAHRAMYPWDKKRMRAVFRGNLAFSKQAVGTCNSMAQCRAPVSWKEMNRGKLLVEAMRKPELFDVGLTSVDPKLTDALKLDGVEPVARMNLTEQQRYKYVVNVGANQDWAERLRNLLFYNFAIIRHEAETQEWFYPLLKQYVHYIPVDASLDNLIHQVQWARGNDKYVHHIVKNANALAEKYINERMMLEYWRLALTRYAERVA